MMNVDQPPLTIPGEPGPSKWIQVTRADCKHHYASRVMILEAAGKVAPKQAIILGAGPCQEIPLIELADRFACLTLNDSDASALERALAASGLGPGPAAKIRRCVADLTGATGPFLERVSEYLDTTDDPRAATAAEALASFAEAAEPTAFRTGQRYELVIASCVLCQLHVAACNRAMELFEARLPGQLPALRQSPDWSRAIYGLARRMERAFIDSLHDLVAPDGRIYLSDTVQGGFVHVTPEGRWLNDGVYRMTRTAQLSDDLDARFRVEQRGRWHWIISPSSEPKGIGRFYNVQALILAPGP
jgi:hypothetical protein